MSNTEFSVLTLDDTVAVAGQIAARIKWPACIYLQGAMGAGKTSFCQGLIAALGNDSAVTSPTYNLIQEYPVALGTVYHMDLYRLNDPSELEYLALPDLWQERSLFLVEWPDNGIGYLPDATYTIYISVDESNSEVRRTIRFQTAQR
jgi:tRNA threonylcarbamoyladenosine biosynthesis protein TsaE